MKNYDHKAIEQKWQERWEKDKLYQTEDVVEGKENFYTLVEFSYPSGNLHVGHWYAFAVTDIFARKKRMEGKNVMFPMGFDAFGLPAENAAIKRGLNPREWTYSNMKHMETQLRSMGASFDWSRKVVTSDPEYYRWTQWLFLQFLKNNLAEQKETLVNWCPSCKTVLANEQVRDGHCERCDTEVEKQTKKQWILNITDYAEKLLEELKDLNWPDQIKESQRNWIGKSEGAEISFVTEGSDEKITVFTTRPDTLMGVSYLVLAPEHPLVDGLKERAKNADEITKYQKQAQKKKEIERIAEGKDKTGVELEGIVVNHPISGKEIPVWVADYVLGSYGTGAVMAVPAHDERDFVFAKKYKLPIKEVVIPKVIDYENPPRHEKETIERQAIQVILVNPKNDKVLMLKWKKFPWVTFITGGVEKGEDVVEAAQREVVEETGYKNIKHTRTLGGQVESHFFADHKDENRKAFFTALVFEIENEEQDEISEEEQALHEEVWMSWDEIEADQNKKCSEYHIWKDRFFNEPHAFTGEGILVQSGTFNNFGSSEAKEALVKAAGGELKSTYKLRDWTVSRQRYWGCPIPVIHCEECGAVPVPDNDLPVVLPEIEDYLPNDEGKSPLSKVTEWVNADCPSCGKDAQRETDTLDTFVDSSWYFLRYTDPKNDKQFAEKQKLSNWMPVDFYSGGAEHTTMHLLYARFFQKALFDFGLVEDNEPFSERLNRGLIMGPDGNKMSKSKGNVIDPDEVVSHVGADAVRAYLSFIGPYNEPGSYPWNPDGVVGVRRFLEKVYGLAEKIGEDEIDVNTEKLLHQTIKKVDEDVSVLKLNTALSQLMILVNHLEKQEAVSRNVFSILLVLLAPFAPHITEELWERLGEKDSIHLQPWPEYDESKIKSDTVEIAVQINGKVRDTITISADADKEIMKKMALESEKIKKWLDGKNPTKIIAIPGRIINIVI